ncbi:MAG: zinc ribbon domain-containing protein [Actinobacteria bacterium]|nr:zinc ribbon domain-containing protein [Actinomycetota bacterium]
MPGYKLPCRYCGKVIPPESHVCPICGKANPIFLRCPKCRGLIEKGWVNCPSCGLSLKVTCPTCKSEALIPSAGLNSLLLVINVPNVESR